MLDEAEINALAQQLGEPVRQRVDCDMGYELFMSRFLRARDRRGEVVLVLERDDGRILLHRKAHYDADHFRLLTGGIQPDEPVLAAALREAAEETGLAVTPVRFLAVLDTTLHFDRILIPFTSCVLHLRATGGELRAPMEGEVAEFSCCTAAELPAVAATLRAIPGERGYWGRWRAVAHDVAAACLNQS